MATTTARPWHVVAIHGGRIVGDETAEKFDKLMIHGPNATVATVYRREDARLICNMVNAMQQRNIDDETAG